MEEVIKALTGVITQNKMAAQAILNEIFDGLLTDEQVSELVESFWLMSDSETRNNQYVVASVNEIVSNVKKAISD